MKLKLAYSDKSGATRSFQFQMGEKCYNDRIHLCVLWKQSCNTVIRHANYLPVMDGWVHYLL